jgi:hypothetical protein
MKSYLKCRVPQLSSTGKFGHNTPATISDNKSHDVPLVGYPSRNFGVDTNDIGRRTRGVHTKQTNATASQNLQGGYASSARPRFQPNLLPFRVHVLRGGRPTNKALTQNDIAKHDIVETEAGMNLVEGVVQNAGLPNRLGQNGSMKSEYATTLKGLGVAAIKHDGGSGLLSAGIRKEMRLHTADDGVMKPTGNSVYDGIF